MRVQTKEDYDYLPKGSSIEVESETETEYTGTWSFRCETIEVTVPKSICKNVDENSIFKDKQKTIEERFERLDALTGDNGVEIEFHFLPEYSTKISLWMDDYHGYHGNTFEDVVSQAEKDFIK